MIHLIPKIPFSLKLIIILLCSYWSALISDKLVNPDASVVVLYLEGIKSPSHYFSNLFQLKSIDFQPVRDLSLFFDIWIYRLSKINLTFIQNLLIWFLSCIYLRKILKTIFPNIKEYHLESMIVLFSAYPLFSTTLLWGVARKHLLSLLFMLIATDELIKDKQGHNSSRKISLFYFLSVFSQPINILWPAWALFWSFLNRKDKFKEYLYYLIPIFIIGFIANYLYYEKSHVFKLFYHSKSEQLTSDLDIILALGHYSLQLVFPHNLTFLYPIGQWEQMVGIGVLVLLPYFFYKKIESKKFLINWGLFGLLPLLIVLKTPNLMMDSYLLVPAIGLLVLVVNLLQEPKKKPILILMRALLVFFIFLNFQESKVWTNMYDFTKAAFVRHSSCNTALNAGIVQYNEKERLEKDLKEFLEKKGCVKIYHKMTMPQVDMIVRISSQILFYEDGISFKDRERSLKNMSQRSEIALYFLSALYAKAERKNELLDTLKKISFDKIPSEARFYERVMDKVVYPYCLKEDLIDCMSKIKGMTIKADRIWL